MSRTAALIAAELGAMLAGQPAALELLRELLSIDVTCQSRDADLEARRAADRARQKSKRIKDAAAKQTMGVASDTSRDEPKEKGQSACNLSSVLSSYEVPESKKVVVVKSAGARGTRLSEGSQISTENRYFAAAAGIPEAEIDRVWAEFVDYWIAVPGQRGTKTKWDATWRNRVRALTPWKGKGRTNGTGTRGLAAAADDLINRLGGDERQAGPVIEHEPC
jgi:hypothetical protein